MITLIIRQLEANKPRIEDWFRDKWQGVPVPLYSSVDIRNSHNKIAVVDTNAFPAGFGNLCPKYGEQVTLQFREHLEKHFPNARNILLIPELHTRNKYYLENVKKLLEFIGNAGYQVRAGSFDPELRSESVTLPAVEGEVVLDKIFREDHLVRSRNFNPHLIISNNDFTAGVPELLRDLSIPVAPPPRLGWHKRKKHRHFIIMNELIEEFARMTGIPPWCLCTYVSWTEQGDLNHADSRERVAGEVDELLDYIGEEHKCRGIEESPSVFIKNNAGTYGMAVMTVSSGDQVREANRKTRTKMAAGKGRSPVAGYIMQEGIPTRDEMDNFPMEPVIHLVGERPVGGFYRLHRNRSMIQNLNVKGMEFRRLCFHQVSEKKPQSLDDGCEDATSLLMVYGTLSRLAVLALGMEMKELEDAGEY